MHSLILEVLSSPLISPHVHVISKDNILFVHLVRWIRISANPVKMT